MMMAKYEFLKSLVEYLGHCIDLECLHTTASQLKAVARAPVPPNVHGMRCFLGLLNYMYYGRFIPNLFSMLHPLKRLLQQVWKWKWTMDCEEVFNCAKKSLTSSRVLVDFDPTLLIKLGVDASAYKVGAVIMHVQSDGSERPIAFTSLTSSSRERSFAQVEKEALALI